MEHFMSISALILTTILVMFTYHSIYPPQKEIGSNVDCLNEVGYTGNLFRSIHDRNYPKELKCFLECEFKKIHVFTPEGNIRKEVLMGHLLQEQTNQEHVNKLSIIANLCINEVESTNDNCEKAFLLERCLVDKTIFLFPVKVLTSTICRGKEKYYGSMNISYDSAVYPIGAKRVLACEFKMSGVLNSDGTFNYKLAKEMVVKYVPEEMKVKFLEILNFCIKTVVGMKDIVEMSFLFEKCISKKEDEIDYLISQKSQKNDVSKKALEPNNSDISQKSQKNDDSEQALEPNNSDISQKSQKNDVSEKALEPNMVV